MIKYLVDFESHAIDVDGAPKINKISCSALCGTTLKELFDDAEKSLETEYLEITCIKRFK